MGIISQTGNSSERDLPPGNLGLFMETPVPEAGQGPFRGGGGSTNLSV